MASLSELEGVSRFRRRNQLLYDARLLNTNDKSDEAVPLSLSLSRQHVCVYLRATYGGHGKQGSW